MSKQFQIGLLLIAFLAAVMTSYAVWKQKKVAEVPAPAAAVEEVKPAEAPASESK